MTTDEIKLGETYDISISAQDSDGAAITMDGTWLAACAFTSDHVGGTVMAEPTMTIAAGVATASIDTGAAIWSVGDYFYDIRLTDPDGNDYWTDPIKLEIQTRNTPAS